MRVVEQVQASYIYQSGLTASREGYTRDESGTDIDEDI
jgi:hypothetical protein